MKGLISKILCGFLIMLIGVVSISAVASTPAEKKYIDLVLDNHLFQFQKQ